MRGSLRYVISALVVFTGFFVLGAIVSNSAPGPIDRSELGTYGAAVPLARFFTGVGRFPTYFVLSVLAVIFGLLRRDWLRRVLIAVIGLVVVWQTSDLVKLAFHRARPQHPILAETSFSYPSGHADLALFFYGFWAYCVWKTSLPSSARALLLASLTLWTSLIGWSRLALGAHFPSDVVGGYLLGGGFLLLAIAMSNSARKTRHTSAS